MPTATIAIPPFAEHVRVVRMVAGAAARRGRVPEDTIDDVRLAVGEAVARVVLRHQRSGIDGDVVVTLSDDPEAFEVEITDLAPSDLPDDDDGLSVALMAALAPHTSLSPGADGVQRIHLAWPTSGDDADFANPSGP